MIANRSWRKHGFQTASSGDGNGDGRPWDREGVSMPTVVAIAYPDEDPAERARATVWQLEEELFIARQAFQQQVLDAPQPGTSALFMLIQHASPDAAIAALEQYAGDDDQDVAFR
jgi:hypothetical protein